MKKWGASFDELEDGPPVAAETGLDTHGRVCRASPEKESELEDGPSDGSSADTESGVLIAKDGHSRYISNRLWASMAEEIAEMRDVLGSPSSEHDSGDMEPPYPPEDPAEELCSVAGQGFVFAPFTTDLRNFLPSPAHLMLLWEAFEGNVDPLTKVLHRPTVQNLLGNVCDDPTALTREIEALLFAICFAAAVSVSPIQSQKCFGETKQALVRRFRFAAEQALARAGFLTSSSLMVLQAFVIYIICLRTEDHRKACALTNLAINLAQALGIHRDGTHFKLSPLDTEIRRRLWWSLFAGGVRCSEDVGIHPLLSTHLSDTKFPMNIADDDITPEMREWPQPREGCTEMTLCLIRNELTSTMHRLSSFGAGTGHSSEEIIEKKERAINACFQRMEQKYLVHCDMGVPIYWLCATMCRIILAKMWIMTHHPSSFFPRQSQPISTAVREKLFTTSIEVLEALLLIERKQETARWRWMIHTHVQWHAMVYVLTELCLRPPGEPCNRAWRAIESVHDQLVNDPNSRRGLLWKPIVLLTEKARRHWAVQTRGLDPMPSDRLGSLRSDHVPTTSDPGFQPDTSLGGTMPDGVESFDAPGTNEPMVGNSSGFDQPVDGDPLQDVLMSQQKWVNDNYQTWIANEQSMQQNMGHINWFGWEGVMGDIFLGHPVPAEELVNFQQ